MPKVVIADIVRKPDSLRAAIKDFWKIAYRTAAGLRQPLAGTGTVLRTPPAGPCGGQVAIRLADLLHHPLEFGMSVAPSPSPSSPAAPGSEARAAHELAQQAKQLNQKVAAEVARVVVGVEAVTQQLLIALLAGGHVLLEGVPGVAKTTLSKVFARLLGCQYQRVQFTPDLLPSDVTGTSIFDRNANEFVLRKGPIFTQVLLADEINRAPAKTQAGAPGGHAGVPGHGGRQLAAA